MTSRMKAGCALLVASIFSAIAHAQLSPEDTVKSLELAPGLEASVWAAEPMLVNPTNIDIDSRGRVWVCEGANYRKSITRPEGDRIVILEDTDHDGKANSQKVFVQDTKLKSPLGVCVLGNKVYVSLSPNILVYTIDATGDKPVGPPEVWMTGFEGAEHDHGIHTITFGPDGRFYFNSGNAGTDVKQPFKFGNGKEVVDRTGSDVPTGPMWRGSQRKAGQIGYQQGMAFRCNPDGSRFDVLGYNFRNNYELAADSFGTVWQSDNDDDGNQGVRLNFVMEGGNFGYHGPEGHDWQRDRDVFPGQTVQQAHWHQKWPGVVPNMLQTGAGSPTGIVAYEGELLPQKFRGALIHCDPGPNVIRAYTPHPSAQAPTKIYTDDRGGLEGPDRAGAGYKPDVVTIAHGKDKWFRPSDVCVAPDGSLFVADWYDPGVGGHQTADQPKNEPPDWHKLRGRIYRIAPTGSKSSVPRLDLSSMKGLIAALKSPNQATRYWAFSRLTEERGAEKALAAAFAKEPNPRYRARMLWLLARGPHPASHVDAGLKDRDDNVRIAAFRAARQTGLDVVALANRLIDGEPSPGMLREIAVAMNYEPASRAIPVLLKLASKYDGQDRWMLEAIGIGATGKEDAFLAAYKPESGKAAETIRWRMKMELPQVTVTASPDKPTGVATTAPNPNATKDATPLPPIDQLAKESGDAKSGEKVFANVAGANCIRCHQIGDKGQMLGPPLTAIGQKLTKPQLYEAILKPNAGILMGYESWVVKTKKGEVFGGLKTSDTAKGITIKDTDGKYHDVPADQIARQAKQNVSIMPEGLANTMSKQELVDLVEYLSTLKPQQPQQEVNK